MTCLFQPHSGNTNKTAENDGIKTLEDFIAKSNCSSELKHKLEVNTIKFCVYVRAFLSVYLTK